MQPSQEQNAEIKKRYKAQRERSRRDPAGAVAGVSHLTPIQKSGDFFIFPEPRGEHDIPVTNTPIPRTYTLPSVRADRRAARLSR